MIFQLPLSLAVLFSARIQNLSRFKGRRETFPSVETYLYWDTSNGLLESLAARCLSSSPKPSFVFVFLVISSVEIKSLRYQCSRHSSFPKLEETRGHNVALERPRRHQHTCYGDECS